jgi:hypothetical protein
MVSFLRTRTERGESTPESRLSGIAARMHSTFRTIPRTAFRDSRSRRHLCPAPRSPSAQLRALTTAPDGPWRPFMSEDRGLVNTTVPPVRKIRRDSTTKCPDCSQNTKLRYSAGRSGISRRSTSRAGGPPAVHSGHSGGARPWVPPEERPEPHGSRHPRARPENTCRRASPAPAALPRRRTAGVPGCALPTVPGGPGRRQGIDRGGFTGGFRENSSKALTSAPTCG